MYLLERPEEGHFQIRESRKRRNKFHAKQDSNPLPPDHMACALQLCYNYCPENSLNAIELASFMRSGLQLQIE